MGKLMKYEFRKTLFSKAILLLVTAAAEILYLCGVFLKWSSGLGRGSVLLLLCAVIGIFYIGLDSLLVLGRDLNTKQSYMLFMTPRNSFEILGAKVLENGISILLTGVCFAALIAADCTIGLLYIGGVKEFLNTIQWILDSISLSIDLTVQDAVIVFFSLFASWLMMVVTGYLAIILSATFLAGKRLSGLISFLIFTLLTWISGVVMDFWPPMENIMLRSGLVIGTALGISVVLYLAAAWIMEQKLSV